MLDRIAAVTGHISSRTKVVRDGGLRDVSFCSLEARVQSFRCTVAVLKSKALHLTCIQERWLGLCSAITCLGKPGSITCVVCIA